MLNRAVGLRAPSVGYAGGSVAGVVTKAGLASA